MKNFLLVMLALVMLVGCNSLDGTTLEDQEEVKKNQPVDMSGK